MLLRAYGTGLPAAGGLARWFKGLAASFGLVLFGCAGATGPDSGPVFGEQFQPRPVQEQTMLGAAGGVRVGLLLPLSADGNAGVAAQSMRRAAELALEEFADPNIQLIVKDDGGTAQGAQMAAQQAISEGAEIVLGPLFSHAVAAAGQTTRSRSIPMIAFSTDSNVAARGVYLLSFQPENNVERIVNHSIASGKKSFLTLIPDNAYGTVVEGHFRQVMAARGGRVAAIETYQNDPARMAEAVRKVAAAVRQADSVFIADALEPAQQVAQLLASQGVSPRRLQFVGTDLWDDPSLFADPNFNGAWFAAPDPSGFQAFAARYQARFGQQPVRTASLAYDAVSLAAALVKTQGAARFSEQVLTNPSGFQGIDGIFRFRNDGTSERGLAVMEIRDGATRMIGETPRSFATPVASN